MRGRVWAGVSVALGLGVGVSVACSSTNDIPAVDTSSPGGNARDGGVDSGRSSSSGSGSSGSGSSSGSSSGSTGEVVVVPCNVNESPGVTSKNSYGFEHSLIFTITGTCGMFPATVWAGGACGAVESAPQTAGGTGTGSVGNDAVFQFATPGPCGEDSGLPVAPASEIFDAGPDATVYVDSIWGVAGPEDAGPGNFNQAPTAYSAAHSYKYIWVSPADAPVTFWVNNPYAPADAGDGVYGSLSITIVDESAK